MLNWVRQGSFLMYTPVCISCGTGGIYTLSDQVSNGCNSAHRCNHKVTLAMSLIFSIVEHNFGREFFQPMGRTSGMDTMSSEYIHVKWLSYKYSRRMG